MDETNIKDDVFLVGKINNLKNKLNSPYLNLRTLRKQMNEIVKYDEGKQSEYLKSLLDPDSGRCVKIPSRSPMPSSTFQLHAQTYLKTNQSGNCAIFVNPFFLANEKAIGTVFYPDNNPIFQEGLEISGYVSTFFKNTDNTLTGTESNDKWESENFGQTLPNIYDSYRLVSASLEVRYIGKVDEAKGVIGGAIVYDKTNVIGTEILARASTPLPAAEKAKNPDISKFGDFNIARTCFFKKENLCSEGIKMLYFPTDNSYSDFVKTYDGRYTFLDYWDLDPLPVIFPLLRLNDDCIKTGFNWFVYVNKGPTIENDFKVDMICNFEAIPSPKLLDYIPISLDVHYVHPDLIKKMIEEVQKKSIQKLNNF